MNKTVLVVDDEIEIVRLFSTCLELDGFDVFTTMNGHQAISIIEDKHVRGVPFDLVILDLNMAALSGFELIDELEKKKIAPSILVVTALISKSIIMKLEQRGISNFLEKPFAIDVFTDKIQQCLNEKMNI